MSKPMAPPKLEDLKLFRNKVQSEISNMNLHLYKIKADRTRLKHMLFHYSDNVKCLQKHLGVINMKQYKTLKENMFKCNFFLKNIENDIVLLEKAIAKANKQLEKIDKDIEHWTEYNARKVLQFPAKEKKCRTEKS